jgi:hypothetical protein
MKLTDIDHEKDGGVHVRWGKHGIQFQSLELLKDWVADVLQREDVRRAMTLRRALKLTNGTLKPVKDVRGLRVDVDFESDTPVTISKDVA